MKKFKLLFAFDHELPLGGALSYEKGIFGQTDKIIKLTEEINAPITLFTDILSYYKFREWGVIDEYAKPFKEQIHKALNANNDVQLHIHAQWIDTTYKNGQFYPSQKYTLADFAAFNDERSIENIIKLSRDELYAMCSELKPDYKCIAYRAGGLALYPETKRILTSLYDNGIRIDTSIPKGYYWKTTQMEVDYRNVPKTANWFIPLDGQLNVAAKEGMFEVAIAFKPKNFITNLPTRFKRKKYIDRAYDCGALPFPTKAKWKFWDFILQSFSPRALSFDVYTQDLKDLINILDYNIDLYKNEEVVYLASMCHPKLMGDYAINLMKEFILELRKNYSDLVEITTFAKIYEELEL
jgi:hypothetical protein